MKTSITKILDIDRQTDINNKEKADVYDEIVALLKYRKEADDEFEAEDGAEGREWDSAEILEQIQNIIRI